MLQNKEEIYMYFKETLKFSKEIHNLLYADFILINKGFSFFYLIEFMYISNSDYNLYSENKNHTEKK